MSSKVFSIALALTLGACAARTVTPMAMTQQGDEALTCSALDQQIADNTAANAAYMKKDKQVDAENIAKDIGSAIPYAGILIAGTTDLSNEEQVKARALADRNEHLQYLKKQKGCP
jgi:hypothetical protein